MKTHHKVGLLLVTLASLLLVGDAEAIIGRPFTPMSFAGVARRTTRRAVVVGAAAGAYSSPYNPYYYW